MKEVLDHISTLVENFKYRPLLEPERVIAHSLYNDNLNGFEINGSQTEVYLDNGKLFSKGYDRVVIGDYGAYIEFSEDQITCELEVQVGQYYRTLEKYKNCKYEWLCPFGYQNRIKVYKQRHRVLYADYTPSKYYVSVFELKQK